MNLILASNSPRRKELLTKFGFDFRVITSNFSEESKDELPVETAKSNARGKAQSVFDSLNKECRQNSVVLGADTIVCIDGAILGKPKNEIEAQDMLKRLSNKTHQVITGYCIITKDTRIEKAEISQVTFNNLSKSLINEYIESRSPFDKAGGYGIQDEFNLVKSYSGSFNNIVGLPIEVFEKELNEIIKK